MFLLTIAGLFMACNNDNNGKDKYDRDKGQADARAKDDYLNNDKNGDSKANSGNNKTSAGDESSNLGAKTSKDGWGNKGNSEGWAGSDEIKFMTECAGTATTHVDAVRANQYCDCMLQKLIKMYPTYADADSDMRADSEGKMDKLMNECNRQ